MFKGIRTGSKIKFLPIINFTGYKSLLAMDVYFALCYSKTIGFSQCDNYCVFFFLNILDKQCWQKVSGSLYSVLQLCLSQSDFTLYFHFGCLMWEIFDMYVTTCSCRHLWWKIFLWDKSCYKLQSKGVQSSWRVTFFQRLAPIQLPGSF